MQYSILLSTSYGVLEQLPDIESCDDFHLLGCEAYIDFDLFDNSSCQSCIQSDTDIWDTTVDNNHCPPDENKIWSLAYQELYLPTIRSPS